MTQANPPHIVQQQLALDAYLSTLLDEIPETDAALDVEPPVAEHAVEKIESQPPPHTTVAISRKTRLSSTRIELVESVNQAKLQPLAVMPEWAQHEFQALFFKVDQLILATPLIELSRTIKLDRKLGKMPGQPSWFMGLLDEPDSRIGVLDTGQLIFGKSRGGQRDLEQKPFKRILVTEDKRWGLACDEILSIGKLQPEKVRWRTSRQKKPWLIGTVIDELAAIIDLQALVPHRKTEN